MPAPGVTVELLEVSNAVIVAPTDTSVAFITGLSDRGPTTPAQVLSLDDFVKKFGDRQTYSIVYDWIQAHFREGGSLIYFSRVVGPAATVGTRNLLDAGAGVSLTVNALGAGAWSANYKVAVVAGSIAGTFAIHITDAANNVLEDSGNLTNQDDAIAWSSGSDYVRIVLGATALPPAVLAPTALSAGTDDRASVTDAHWLIAQNKFASDLGPGQVMQPGRTTTTAHDQLIAHAEANNRVAILDLPDTATVATLTAAKGTSRFAASFAPWYVIPGLTQGTTRLVPPSAIVSGIIARNDPSLGPNKPAAGKDGATRYAIGLSQQAWIETDRSTLNNAGVNVIRDLYGSLLIYGWRSGTDPTTDSNWIGFGNARLYMALAAELNQVGQNYAFDEIDGQNGHTINSFRDAIAGALMEHFNNGELFGDTADQAFDVDTGPSVNTLQTIAAMELHANAYVTMAPMAERVLISVVKRPIAA